jgi:hypothetical protein
VILPFNATREGRRGSISGIPIKRLELRCPFPDPFDEGGNLPRDLDGVSDVAGQSAPSPRVVVAGDMVGPDPTAATPIKP